MRTAVAVLLAAAAAAVPALPFNVRADITGYQGSPADSGWNSTQADLLPTEVTDPAFGQRFDLPVNGQVFAQPVISDDGGGRRVLVAATANNEVYGVSPDSSSAAAYWHDTLAAPWVIAKNSSTVNCTDITPNVGVISTPVVDTSTHTVYLTSKMPDPADSSGATGMYRLHALSLVDGSERTGFPVTIGGTADNDPSITFDPTKQLQRPGLLLMNGVVYMGFGGHCDTPTYYGWVIGVGAYGAASNAATITARWVDQKAADGYGGGIWMAGSALASDASGNIVLVTGNGTLPEANPPATVIAGSSPPNNLGEAAMRLIVQSNGKLAATDFFSPSNNQTLNHTDLDLGSSGIALLPASFGTTQHPNVAVLGGKVPTLRSVDLSNLGGFDANTDHVMGSVSYAVNGGSSGTWGRPAAWPGDGGWVYIVDMGDVASSGSPRTSGLVALQRTVDASGNVQFVVKGTDPAADADWIQTSGSPTVTSNGSSPLTAVVWAQQNFGHFANQSRLMAFGPVPDSSGQLPLLWTGPLFKRGGKFTAVAVDNNHVYVGTRDDTINTGGGAHVYGYWLSKVPDMAETPFWFGNQTIGQGRTITQTLPVRASSAVTITGVQSSDAHFAVGTLSPAGGTSMAPASTVQVPVTFTPTATGDVRSTVTLTMSDSTTVSIGVGGTGVPAPAQLTASPATVPFGNHATGSSTPSSFQLSNTGGQPLTIGTSALSGNGAFSVSGIPGNGTTMQPGDTVPVNVTYAPSQGTPQGTTDTATQTVNSSAGAAVITFTGTASAPGVLSVTLDHVNAGSVPLGSSATLHFTVSNTGGTSISLSRSKPPGGDFHPLTQLPEATSLTPGESVGVDVQFSPTATGSQAATWSLNSDGQGGPITVTLTGTGVLPPAGYWLVAADGGIFPFGNAAQGLGSTGNIHLNRPIVGMAGMPDGGGYWLVAADGGIFPFGDATPGLGSTGNVHLNQPIVGMASTPDGRGYWLVAADGGIFPFGDAAQGLGSTGSTHLNQPIVGMAATRDGGGYWLVAADGGIFPFGDAAQGLGSTGGQHLNQPIVGMASTPDGGGYWLVAADGGIFPFGDAARGLGSTGGQHLNQPMVGMAATRDGGGYWLVAADGGIFPFGDAAQGLGSTGGQHLNQPIVGMAAVTR
ncbi:MAG TPA: choice-of-anchor D domain-containing protein [Candidatus Angelobacter sp.]|jgi:hypothetical protein|nr:choice-of-anchor D domain-containing protein [Candidatus Angelobacter sp.]